MANYFPLIANTTSSQIQEIPVGSFLDLSQSGIANSGNITVNGLVSVTGNVAGTYLLGNGAFITGLPAGYSNADVADYLPTYTGNLVSLTGNIITTGNITASYILPQSNATTDLGSNTLQWRSLYVSNNTIYIGGVSVGVTANGQLSVGNATVVTEGTALTGNIDTAGNISAGNIITTGIITGGSTTVTSLVAAAGGTGGSISVKNPFGTPVITLDGGTGNVSAGNTDATNFVASANITAVGNVSAGNIISSGAITGGTTTVTTLEAAAGGTGGSITVKSGPGNIVITLDGGSGDVTATGNVTGAYLLGNGAFISGLPAGYSNADVANYLASGSLTSNIVTTGNINGGNLAITANITTDNLNVGTLLDVKDIAMTGAVLTNFTVGANISAGNLEVMQDAVILGNLRVEGNTTYINVSDLIVEDKDIIVGANASATLSDLNGAGLQIGNISAGGNITFFYNSTSNTMALSHGANIANTVGVTGNINATGNISGLYLLGNGSQLTGISAGAAIADDTSTNSNYYPVFATATSGSLTTATISSTKLTFNPSTGQLTAVDVNTSSDVKYKDNVQPIASALDTINSIEGVSFNWKETGQRSYGVIAQDLAKVLPELVHSAERGLTVSYLPLIAILIEAIKEQQQQIDQLKNNKPS